MEAAEWQQSRRLGIDMSWRGVAEAIFSDLIVSRPARSFLNSTWRVAPGPLGDLPGEILLRQRHAYGTDEWIMDLAGAGFVLIEHAGQEVKVRIAAHSVQANEILAAPPWTDVACNYPLATAGAILPLLAEDWRPAGGRLLLWHGEPGRPMATLGRAGGC